MVSLGSLFAQDAIFADDAAAAEGSNPETLIRIEDEPEGTAARQPVVSTWDFVRMLLILGGVVGVIYLLFFLLKRGTKNRYPQNELIRLMDHQNLSGNRSLHLVGVGDSVFLVGSAENGVTLISEIADKNTLDQLRFELSQKTEPARRNFSEILMNLFRTGEGKGVSVADTVNFMKQQKDRLKKMRE
jgi:flagellar protein FliO/FliZ